MIVTARAIDARYAFAIKALFAAALALRLYFVLVLHPARAFVYSDMQSYDSVALEILGGHVSPWHAFRPVAYSMLLSGSYWLTDASRTFVGVLQALMGAATVPWSAQLARAAGADRSSAVLVASLLAVSLPLVFYCGLVLTELPTAFCLLLGLKLAVVPRRRSSKVSPREMWAGLTLGLAGALRPNLLLVYPLVAWYLLARCERVARRRTLALFACALLLPVLVVSAYNSLALARLAGPSANGGINFYLNFADVHTLQYQGPLGAYWISPVPNGFRHTRHELSSVPLFEDRYYYAAGLRFVRQRPEVLLAALDNFREAAGIGKQLYWPNWQGHELLFRRYALGFFGLVLVPALLFLCSLAWPSVRRKTSREGLLLAALCVVSALPIYLFLGDPRVRVPFDPLWTILAGLAFQRAWRGARARFASGVVRAAPP